MEDTVTGQRCICVPKEEAPLSTHHPDAVHVEWHPGMLWPPLEIHDRELSTPYSKYQGPNSDAYSRNRDK
jgi:hypothetical protein